ncbi:MAG: CapA family protein [Tissierellaceae bacterium]
MKKRYLFILTFIIIISIVLVNKLQIRNAHIVNEEIFEHIERDLKEENIKNIDLLAVGDIMFHIPQIKSAKIKDGSYDFVPVFKHVREYIEGADIAIANFETVTVDERRYSGFPRFNSPGASILALKEIGFDILSTANNHSLDQGKQGVISTLKNIEDVGLKSIGTYNEPQTELFVEEVQGINIGFLSYTYGVNGLEATLSKEELSYMINLIDEDKIEKDISDLREREVDIIVVFIHWGYEYHREPSKYQIELGNKMIGWGANIVLGSHPHVIQRAETIDYNGKNNFVIYSMGNFISNQSEITTGNPYTEDGVMVKINIEKNLESGETSIKDIDYIPTWVHKFKEEGKLKYEILPVPYILSEDLNLDLNEKTMLKIKRSYVDTMKVLENQ